jgi:glutaredoxin 2
MALGFLKIPYESSVLGYDDEETPIKLTQVKMLPIMGFDNGTFMNESLEIISKVDNENLLDVKATVLEMAEIDAWTNQIGKSVHSTAMPYWMWTPEFNEKSREYFQTKKERKRGPFSELVKKQPEFIETLDTLLKKLEENLTPFYNSKTLSLRDIILASHLWGMYIVPEYQFSNKMHSYLQKVKLDCNFDYHEDFWR